MFTVKTEDLIKTSNSYIAYVCDYCGEEVTTMYINYLRNKGTEVINKDCCARCQPIKTKESCLIKYGVESTNSLQITQDKKEKTSLIKYGTKSSLQNSIIKEKIRDTMIERYGVEHPLQSDIIFDKFQNTLVERYGIDNLMQSDEFKEKAVLTNIERYGVENPLQNEDIKNKVIATNIERYGVKSTSQVPEIREKQVETLYQNQSVCTSIQQRYLHNLLGGKMNYPVGRCNVDILLDDNIVVEYNGGGHNLRVKTEKISKREFDNKERKRDCFLRDRNYKVLKIQSDSDDLPADEVLLSMIDFARKYFTQDHSWIEFNIDNLTVKTLHSEQSYNYGKLRKITKKDI
jgi:very-short-patch-repair endonuclease